MDRVKTFTSEDSLNKWLEDNARHIISIVDIKFCSFPRSTTITSLSYDTTPIAPKCVFMVHYQSILDILEDL